MSLPGTASIPAVDAARHRAAEATGLRAVELAREGLRPSQILTPEAFDNAITVLMAIGGATNAVIHLLALAGRVGAPLTLERFDDVSRQVPMLANIRPSGEHLVEQLHRAGGVPALLKELEHLLHGDAMTVTGRTLADGFAQAQVLDRSVIASIDEPLAPEAGIAVLRGSLAPGGAVIKQSAASPSLLRHRGPAIVFEDVYDVQARIDDPALEVSPESVLVLRNSGPKGGPGMPEWGMLPIPKKLAKQGVRDMLRISDARMSGTSYGACILHVAPESFVGGPLNFVQTGDEIEIDVDKRSIHLHVSDAEMARRKAAWKQPPPKYPRGYGAMFSEHIGQADQGCDFDFLQGKAAMPEPEIH